MPKHIISDELTAHTTNIEAVALLEQYGWDDTEINTLDVDFLGKNLGYYNLAKFYFSPAVLAKLIKNTLFSPWVLATLFSYVDALYGAHAFSNPADNTNSDVLRLSGLKTLLLDDNDKELFYFANLLDNLINNIMPFVNNFIPNRTQMEHRLMYYLNDVLGDGDGYRSAPDLVSELSFLSDENCWDMLFLKFPGISDTVDFMVSYYRMSHVMALHYICNLILTAFYMHSLGSDDRWGRRYKFILNIINAYIQNTSTLAFISNQIPDDSALLETSEFLRLLAQNEIVMIMYRRIFNDLRNDINLDFIKNSDLSSDELSEVIQALCDVMENDYLVPVPITWKNHVHCVAYPKDFDKSGYCFVQVKDFLPFLRSSIEKQDVSTFQFKIKELEDNLNSMGITREQQERCLKAFRLYFIYIFKQRMTFQAILTHTKPTYHGSIFLRQEYYKLLDDYRRRYLDMLDDNGHDSVINTGNDKPSGNKTCVNKKNTEGANRETTAPVNTSQMVLKVDADIIQPQSDVSHNSVFSNRPSKEEDEWASTNYGHYNTDVFHRNMINALNVMGIHTLYVPVVKGIVAGEGVFGDALNIHDNTFNKALSWLEKVNPSVLLLLARQEIEAFLHGDDKAPLQSFRSGRYGVWRLPSWKKDDLLGELDNSMADGAIIVAYDYRTEFHKYLRPPFAESHENEVNADATGGGDDVQALKQAMKNDEIIKNIENSGIRWSIVPVQVFEGIDWGTVQRFQRYIQRYGVGDTIYHAIIDNSSDSDKSKIAAATEELTQALTPLGNLTPNDTSTLAERLIQCALKLQRKQKLRLSYLPIALCDEQSEDCRKCNLLFHFVRLLYRGEYYFNRSRSLFTNTFNVLRIYPKEQRTLEQLFQTVFSPAHTIIANAIRKAVFMKTQPRMIYIPSGTRGFQVYAQHAQYSYSLALYHYFQDFYTSIKHYAISTQAGCNQTEHLYPYAFTSGVAFNDYYTNTLTIIRDATLLQDSSLHTPTHYKHLVRDALITKLHLSHYNLYKKLFDGDLRVFFKPTVAERFDGDDTKKEQIIRDVLHRLTSKKYDIIRQSLIEWAGIFNKTTIQNTYSFYHEDSLNEYKYNVPVIPTYLKAPNKGIRTRTSGMGVLSWIKRILRNALYDTRLSIRMGRFGKRIKDLQFLLDTLPARLYHWTLFENLEKLTTIPNSELYTFLAFAPFLYPDTREMREFLKNHETDFVKRLLEYEKNGDHIFTHDGKIIASHIISDVALTAFKKSSVFAWTLFVQELTSCKIDTNIGNTDYSISPAEFQCLWSLFEKFKPWFLVAPILNRLLANYADGRGQLFLLDFRDFATLLFYEFSEKFATDVIRSGEYQGRSDSIAKDNVTKTPSYLGNTARRNAIHTVHYNQLLQNVHVYFEQYVQNYYAPHNASKPKNGQVSLSNNASNNTGKTGLNRNVPRLSDVTIHMLPNHVSPNIDTQHALQLYNFGILTRLYWDLYAKKHPTNLLANNIINDEVINNLNDLLKFMKTLPSSSYMRNAIIRAMLMLIHRMNKLRLLTLPTDPQIANKIDRIYYELKNELIPESDLTKEKRS